jgi:hypothetical protein
MECPYCGRVHWWEGCCPILVIAAVLLAAGLLLGAGLGFLDFH